MVKCAAVEMKCDRQADCSVGSFDVRRPERDLGIDFAKGVCIFLVVWGHLPRTGSWEDAFYRIVTTIYAFHIPIFIFISGYLFGNRTGCLGDFKKVVFHVFKPYLIAGCLMLGLYYVAARFGVPTHGEGGSPLFRLLMGHAGGALWYLYTLGLFELLTLAWLWLGKRLKRAVFNPMALVLVLGLASLVCSRSDVIAMQPWFFLYFVVGYFARKVFPERLPATALTIILAVATMAYFPFWRGTLGNFVVTISVLSALLALGRLSGSTACGRLFTFLGRKSLSILLFHPIFIGVLKPCYNGLLKIDGTGTCSMVSTALIVVVSCLFVDWLLCRRNLDKVIY